MSKNYRHIDFNNEDLQNLLCQLGADAPASTPVEIVLMGKIYPVSLRVSTTGLVLKDPLIMFQEQNENETLFQLKDSDHIHTICVHHTIDNDLSGNGSAFDCQ
jgi:6-phosphofructokinase